MSDLRRDAFLGGRLQVWQPVAGYRAGTDPVLLAAAVPARAGESVLELGLGVGTASLCLATRVPGLTLTGVEIQPGYVELARQNASGNGITLEIVQADVGDLPLALRSRSFDHVLTNPPFFAAAGRTPALDPGRETGRGETCPLRDWVTTAMRRLRTGGHLTLIQSIARLPEVLSALSPTGSRVIPLAARQGRPPDRFILVHRKGGRAAFHMSAPLILHDGPQHLRDGDDYAPWATGCLRRAEPLPGSA